MAVKDQLSRLASFTPTSVPVVSLYLNTQPGQTGRDQFRGFVRKELPARSRTFTPGSPERASLDRDLDRISRFLDGELEPAANGVAVFASAAQDLFETIQMTAPIDHHWLSVSDRPHLYPLARVESQYPRYAALLTDTNSARILVFATGEIIAEEQVKGVKTKRMAQGGWSQARFQRHVENFHVQHVKEVVDALDRIVLREGITEIVVSGDEVILPLLREQLPKHLAEKIVDHVRVASDASIDQIVQTSLEAMRRVHSQTEREKVEAAVGAYRAGGLGVVGAVETLDALVKGQVEELLITASVRQLQPVGAGGGTRASSAIQAVLPQPAVQSTAAGEPADVDADTLRLADELTTKGAQTADRITFVDDPSLLAPYGGVAALLRFRI
jgi:peptide chain release factor subunit 1